MCASLKPPSRSLGTCVRDKEKAARAGAQHWQSRAPGHARDTLEVQASKGVVSFEHRRDRGTFTNMTDPVSAGSWGSQRGVPHDNSGRHFLFLLRSQLRRRPPNDAMHVPWLVGCHHIYRRRRVPQEDKGQCSFALDGAQSIMIGSSAEPEPP